MAEKTATDRTIVLYLLRGAVPERADEISRLWSEYDPKVEVAPSAMGVTMNANRHRIRFDTKTVDIFWLLAFSAWRSIEVYSPAVVVALASGATIQQAITIDEELHMFERDYKDRMAAAQSLITATATPSITWPPDIPYPRSDRNGLASLQDKTAFDLATLALAFTLLHEFKHVMFLSGGSQPSTPAEEEIACDVWARSFMTDKLAAYAQEHGYSFEQVFTKRAMGFVLAAAILHSITPTHAHWGNPQYPAIVDRIEALTAGYTLSPDSTFWMFAACLLIGIMRLERRPLDITALTSRELVEGLIDRMR